MMNAVSPSPEELSNLSNSELKAHYSNLFKRFESARNELEWYRKQLFGRKSEKVVEVSSEQLHLGDWLFAENPVEDKGTEVKKHRRSSKKKPLDLDCGVSGLRIEDGVEIIEVEVECPDTAGLTADEYEIIDYEIHDTLCQRESSYYVKRNKRPVVKLLNQDKSALVCPPSPGVIFPGSFADASFLAGLAVDKCIYHIPLYRTHQRLQQAGVHVSRSTLTNYFHAVADFLAIVFNEHIKSIFESTVLTMDEKPIKAGVNKKKRQMKQGYFWPVMGDRDEVAFFFFNSRAHRHVKDLLQHGFSGVLVTDDYAAYERYCAQVESVTHSLCWSHTRRKFLEAEKTNPEEVGTTIATIQKLYKVEEYIKEKQLTGNAKLECRSEYSKQIVATLFEHWRKELARDCFLPKSPYSTALNYALTNKAGLEVFLSNPDVPIDTNHIERQNAQVAIGSRNWLFCSTEVGAEHLGVIYSLLLTAKTFGHNPYAYLTDVLLRVKSTPDEQIKYLTPRLWRTEQDEKPPPES